MAGLDITEKILLAYNDVFADIVNGLLFSGQKIISACNLVDQVPKTAYKIDGKLREIERDVAKRWIKKYMNCLCRTGKSDRTGF